MAAFDPESPYVHELDWQLMANGFVSLFWQPEVLSASVQWLRDNSYNVVTLDAGAWNDEAAMHRAVAEALDFPDYYGENLDALNDCLSDVATYEYASSRRDAGLVLVLNRFDRFLRQDPRVAPIMLDIFASRARVAALVGHRMLCLIRSDDPDIHVLPVGATPVMWNPAEWMDSARHPNRRR